MAVGTVTQTFDAYRNLIITISGIAATGVTPSVRSQGFPIGSYQATGLTATGLTAQLFGSNDNSNFYAIQTAAVTADGLYGLIAQSTTAENLVPLWYRWAISGTFGSGSVTIIAAVMSTFG